MISGVEITRKMFALDRKEITLHAHSVLKDFIKTSRDLRMRIVEVLASRPSYKYLTFCFAVFVNRYVNC